jgi:2-amino-4-hydroxy-6-hydroxymethyldihydropteridine diphosphokinase
MHTTMKTTTKASPNESPNIEREASRAEGAGPALDAVVGLGSNIGDRLGYFRHAARGLRADARFSLRAVSSVYETRAVGPAQADFLNAALRVAFVGTPGELLRLALDVERQLGRVRRERWGPRVIDLDVLWIQGVKVESGDLVVPHPRLLERRFALAPLTDVAPDAVDPRTGASLRDALNRLPDDGVRRFGKSNWLDDGPR